MRNFSIKNYKCDKKFTIAVLVTLLCAIICGIVLYKVANINIYIKNFATDYIYNVFNFKNSSLIFSHILTELIYLYIFFMLSYFTGIKYLALIPFFIRTLFFTIYAAILVALNSIGGIMVAVLVFIPTSIVSLILCYVIVESCKIINKKYIFFVPAVFSAINTIVLVLLVNVLFRVVIIIV